jgi:hypothetical protein
MIIMTSKFGESTKKICRASLCLTVILCLSIFLSNCAYRLTNLHSSTPGNIRTIFVEAVYDTGAEIVPHEQLWDELQRALAANGQIILAPATTADAILRAQIISTKFAKSGERRVSQVNRKTREPDYFKGQTSPPTPGQLRDLSVADDYYMKTTWQSNVRVELWDLRNRKLLLQREYPLSGEVLANRGDVAPQLHHLRHEESYNVSFANAARIVAEKVVTDILIR